MSPLKQLRDWLTEERAAGIAFAHGGVLATTSSTSQPRSRMLGVHLTADGSLRFHTSPTTRKIEDLAHSPRASFTLAFQRSLRSVSIEGVLAELNLQQLETDWKNLTAEFRRSYWVYGHKTGSLRNPGELEGDLSQLPLGAEDKMPSSFCGYEFRPLTRVAYYAVHAHLQFAQHQVFERSDDDADWSCRDLVP